MTTPPKKPGRKPRIDKTPVTKGRFAAIDFETADYGRDSACAVAIITGSEAGIDRTFSTLIRPPRKDFVFTYLHGISWAHVHDKPVFGDVWPEMMDLLDGADFIAAHNASFDRGVMHACCAMSGLAALEKRFLCTVKAARRVWDIRPTTLAHVCDRLSIPLKHHDAESDALACAKIVIGAMKTGIPVDSFLKKAVTV